MRLATKLIVALISVFLASSLLFTYGCSGKGSGGCPDSVAPSGSTITAPTLGGVTHTAGGDCYPIVNFVVLDNNSNPLSDICVEVFASNGVIALHSGSADCHNVAATPQTAIVTRTDASGVVPIELLTLPTTTGGITSVTVVSGALSAVAQTPAATQ